jgi:hypothetical protein
MNHKKAIPANGTRFRAISTAARRPGIGQPRAGRRGLQDPPADELAGGEASPEAEAGYLAGGRDPPLVCMFDLGA